MSKLTYLEEMTSEEVEALDKQRAFIFLPMGPVEAHGPHLPLGVDINGAIHGTEMAAEKLQAKGYIPIIAPTMPYTLADLALPFAGTVSLSRETVISFTMDLARSFSLYGFKHMVVFCHHGERPNLYALQEAAERSEAYGIEVLIATSLIDAMQRMGEVLDGEHPQWDFHAGEFETSLYLWKHPHLVKQNLLPELPANWSNIREKFRDGAKDFVEAGGAQCYFGDPSLATAEKGEKVYELLSDMLTDEIERFLSGK